MTLLKLLQLNMAAQETADQRTKPAHKVHPPTDTSNKFAVVSTKTGHTELFSILEPPRGMMTRADAQLLSAWLAALADPGGEEIARLVKEINS